MNIEDEVTRKVYNQAVKMAVTGVLKLMLVAQELGDMSQAKRMFHLAARIHKEEVSE